MQHQPEACASDLGDDQSQYLWLWHSIYNLQQNIVCIVVDVTCILWSRGLQVALCSLASVRLGLGSGTEMLSEDKFLRPRPRTNL